LLQPRIRRGKKDVEYQSGSGITAVGMPFHLKVVGGRKKRAKRSYLGKSFPGMGATARREEKSH